MSASQTNGRCKTQGVRERNYSNNNNTKNLSQMSNKVYSVHTIHWSYITYHGFLTFHDIIVLWLAVQITISTHTLSAPNSKWRFINENIFEYFNLSEKFFFSHSRNWNKNNFVNIRLILQNVLIESLDWSRAQIYLPRRPDYPLEGKMPLSNSTIDNKTNKKNNSYDVVFLTNKQTIEQLGKTTTTTTRRTHTAFFLL